MKGPGQGEIFGWYRDRDATYGGINRILSSHDMKFRSSKLSPVDHSHPYTLFSKPGSYQMTYRATARGTDGKLIAGAPQTMQWQVGGPTPEPKATPSAKERCDRAPAGDVPAAYRFAVSDLTQPKGQDVAAGKLLTRWSFETGDSSSGTATVLIDGFHMADIPVKDGRGELDQLPSVGSARYQLVYTPAGQGARWISPEVRYAHGKSAAVTGADGSGSFPTPKADVPAPAGHTQEVTLGGEQAYTATVKPGPYRGTFEASVEFADKRVRGFATLGFYDADTTNSIESLELQTPEDHQESGSLPVRRRRDQAALAGRGRAEVPYIPSRSPGKVGRESPHARGDLRARSPHP